VVSESSVTEIIVGEMMMTESHDGWKFRRRMVFGSVIFCGLLMLGLTFWGDPANTLHRLVLENILWAAVGIIGVYIGAPVVDDWLQKRKLNDAAGK
jgi:hypothetical protein